MAAEEIGARIGVLVVSDTRGPESDASGPEVAAALQDFGFNDVTIRFCRDEIELIKTNLIELANHCPVVFSTGGTGFARRDVTPEATLQLIERQANSISELIRLRGLEKTPFAHLSRGVSGIRGNTLLVNLPGSPKGAREGVEAVGHLLPPIIAGLTGKPCPVRTDSA